MKHIGNQPTKENVTTLEELIIVISKYLSDHSNNVIISCIECVESFEDA